MAETDNLRDVFGRARHATHKENAQGIGSFNKECRTLLVSRIKLDPDAVQGKAAALSHATMSTKEVVRIVYELFCSWGEVEDIHFNTARFQAYIKFGHRYYAEFAREAMLDQILVEGVTDPIRIQWALDSPLDKTEAERAQAEVTQALQGHMSFNRRNNKIGPQK